MRLGWLILGLAGCEEPDPIDVSAAGADGAGPTQSGVEREDYDRGLLVERGGARWEYDDAGRLVRSTNMAGAYSNWEYDGEGHVVAMDANASDGGGPDTRREWSWDGNWLRREYAKAGDSVRTTLYVEHDSEGRPIRFESSGGNSLECCWSGDGTWEWGPTGATSYARGGVVERRWTWDGDHLTSAQLLDDGGGVANDNRWTWDERGHVVEQILNVGQRYQERVDRWTWDGDDLVAYELWSDGEWIEDRWWDGCPTPRWPMPEMPVPGPWPEVPQPPSGYGTW